MADYLKEMSLGYAKTQEQQDSWKNKDKEDTKENGTDGAYRGRPRGTRGSQSTRGQRVQRGYGRGGYQPKNNDEEIQENNGPSRRGGSYRAPRGGNQDQNPREN